MPDVQLVEGDRVRLSRRYLRRQRIQMGGGISRSAANSDAARLKGTIAEISTDGKLITVKWDTGAIMAVHPRILRKVWE